MRVIVVAAVAVLGMLAGCSPDVRAEEYPQNCSRASDCAVVASGDPCGCACPNSALRSDAQADFDRDFAAAQRWCNPLAGQCQADCIGATAECSAGTCVARMNGTSDGGI